MGGQFLLRIEDTDQARNIDEATRGIYEALRWLGLEWDEGPEVGGDRGPYYQSQRLDIYREYANKMVAAGTAYRCYCTKDELQALREAHAKTGSKDPWRYPGIWRDRKDWPENKPYVVRLKAPKEGHTAWVDLVKSRIEVPNFAQQDVVLLRADGMPLYNFSCVVDDALMGVTLVARGDDHVVNTPIQIMLYQALGYPVPRFAHMPMILSQSGEKLSKRHAAVNTLEYRDLGYLPDAVINYLARLGWSHGDQEIFTRHELVQHFNFEHVGSTGARYDMKKFNYVQSEHLRSLEGAELLAHAKAFADKTGLKVSDAQWHAAFVTTKTRATTLVDLVEMSRFYFEAPVLDEAAKTKFLKADRAPYLEALIVMLEEAPVFTQHALEALVNAQLEARSWHLKDIAQPARVALTGKTQSPGLYEMMEVLGKDETLKRLRQGLSISTQNP